MCFLSSLETESTSRLEVKLCCSSHQRQEPTSFGCRNSSNLKSQTRYTQLWCIFIIYHREMLFLRSKMKFVDCTWIICFDLMWFLERTKTNKKQSTFEISNKCGGVVFVCLFIFYPCTSEANPPSWYNNRHLICLPWDSN